MLQRIHREQTLPRHGPAIAAERLDGMPDMRLHAHDFVEVALVERGTAVHTTLHGSHVVGPGFAAVVRPGEVHAWEATDDLCLWNVYIGTEVLVAELRWFRQTHLGNSLIGPPPPGGWVARQLDPEDRAGAVGWLELVPDRHDRASAAGTARVGAVGGALGVIAAGTNLAGPTRKLAAGAVAPPVAILLDLLSARIEHSWSIHELAEAVHLSASHLSRLFVQTTGMPPIAYLARMRAERVAADLITSDAPIAEIGARYGWSDPNYVSRRFRSFFGVSPRQFRREYGGPRR